MYGKSVLAAAILALAACSGSSDGGGLNMGVAVEGLGADQNFCFTWKLFEQVGDSWQLTDERTAPLCVANGVDEAIDFATCTHGRRFLVSYNVTFGGTAVGSAVATSGGTDGDICVKNHDQGTWAYLQYRNEGNAGGVNPGIDIDQVCTNDKLVMENGRVVSALWVQPDSCTGQVPDDFCAFGAGTLMTARTGVTADGLTRYVFSTATPEDTFSVFYLVFDPALAADTLYLHHAPWVLQHTAWEGVLLRQQLPVSASFRYNDSVGFLAIGAGGQLEIFYDTTASCNAPIVLDPAMHGFQQLAVPAGGAGGAAEVAGVIPTGGSEFDVILECPEPEFWFVHCDAAGLPGGTICAPL